MSDSDKVCKIINCEHYSDCVCSFCDCIEKAYNKGRVDTEAKWINLPNEYADRLARQSYQRGRADAIDAFIEELLKHKSKDEYPVICMDEWTLKRFAEKVNGETE